MLPKTRGREDIGNNCLVDTEIQFGKMNSPRDGSS